jgi:hypothetical protein
LSRWRNLNDEKPERQLLRFIKDEAENSMNKKIASLAPMAEEPASRGTAGDQCRTPAGLMDRLTTQNAVGAFKYAEYGRKPLLFKSTAAERVMLIKQKIVGSQAVFG